MKSHNYIEQQEFSDNFYLEWQQWEWCRNNMQQHAAQFFQIHWNPMQRHLKGGRSQIILLLERLIYKTSDDSILKAWNKELRAVAGSLGRIAHTWTRCEGWKKQNSKYRIKRWGAYWHLSSPSWQALTAAAHRERPALGSSWGVVMRHNQGSSCICLPCGWGKGGRGHKGDTWWWKK